MEPPCYAVKRFRLKKNGVKKPSFGLNGDQFLDLSTILLIQGIMARSFSPVTSMG